MEIFQRTTTKGVTTIENILYKEIDIIEVSRVE